MPLSNVKQAGRSTSQPDVMALVSMALERAANVKVANAELQ